MWSFCWSRSLAAVVADDFVDLYDDVLGDAGLYGSAIKRQSRASDDNTIGIADSAEGCIILMHF